MAGLGSTGGSDRAVMSASSVAPCRAGGGGPGAVAGVAELAGRRAGSALPAFRKAAWEAAASVLFRVAFLLILLAILLAFRATSSSPPVGRRSRAYRPAHRNGNTDACELIRSPSTGPHGSPRLRRNDRSDQPPRGNDMAGLLDSEDERARRRLIQQAGLILTGLHGDMPESFVSQLLARAAPEDLARYEA